MSEREWLGNLDSSARRAHELTAKRQLLSASTLFAKSCRGVTMLNSTKIKRHFREC